MSLNLTAAAEPLTLEQVTAMTPAEAFAPGMPAEIVSRLRQRAKSFELDASTDKGRKQIASVARSIASARVALDEKGMALTEEWRKRTNTVNADRRMIRAELDALRDEVRQPLTDFEEAAKRRTEAFNADIEQMASLGRPDAIEMSVADLEARADELRRLYQRDWAEFGALAEKAFSGAADAIRRAIDAARQRDAERAELERLRAERAQADAERIERERREREARIEAEARAKAERDAEAERNRLQREAEAATERAAAAERARVAQEAAAAEAEAKRRADNLEHRRKVNRAAAKGLVAAGLTEDQAQAVITAIAAGKVAHVAITY